MAFFEFPHTRTYNSDLGWLIKDYGTLAESIATLEDCCQDVQTRLKALEDIMSQLQSGKLPAQIQNAINNYLSLNLKNILGDMIIKAVWFGLTDTGYWYAVIPDSWADIVFKTTGLDITLAIQPEYGHLVLQYT